MVKSWLIDKDKTTKNNFVLITQIKEIPNFCVYDIEKTHKLISDLRQNIGLSVVGFEMCNDDTDVSFKKLVIR